MPRTEEERAHTSQLEQRYADQCSEVFLEIEREVLGSDYGATSWTDREEAERFAAHLRLAPGSRALEVGAGSGWPGLYLAQQTGGAIVLADLPREGLRLAARRAGAEGLLGRATPIVSDAASLPFPSAHFDAVYHCDVLC